MHATQRASNAMGLVRIFAVLLVLLIPKLQECTFCLLFYLSPIFRASDKVQGCDPAQSTKNHTIRFFTHFLHLFAEESHKLQNKHLKTAISSMNFVFAR